MDWDQAGLWARETAQNISGLQIPYFAVMDFSGFEQAIDKVGGVGRYSRQDFYRLPIS